MTIDLHPTLTDRRILLTPGEVAEIVQVDEATLGHWGSAGVGPAPIAAADGSVMYDLADVQDLLTRTRREDPA